MVGTMAVIDPINEASPTKVKPTEEDERKGLIAITISMLCAVANQSLMSALFIKH